MQKKLILLLWVFAVSLNVFAASEPEPGYRSMEALEAKILELEAEPNSKLAFQGLLQYVCDNFCPDPMLDDQVDVLQAKAVEFFTRFSDSLLADGSLTEESRRTLMHSLAHSCLKPCFNPLREACLEVLLGKTEDKTREELGAELLAEQQRIREAVLDRRRAEEVQIGALLARGALAPGMALLIAPNGEMVLVVTSFPRMRRQ